MVTFLLRSYKYSNIFVKLPCSSCESRDQAKEGEGGEFPGFFYGGRGCLYRVAVDKMIFIWIN